MTGRLAIRGCWMEYFCVCMTFIFCLTEPLSAVLRWGASGGSTSDRTRLGLCTFPGTMRRFTSEAYLKRGISGYGRKLAASGAMDWPNSQLVITMTAAMGSTRPCCSSFKAIATDGRPLTHVKTNVINRINKNHSKVGMVS